MAHGPRERPRTTTIDRGASPARPDLPAIRHRRHASRARACLVLDNHQDAGADGPLDTVLALALQELPEGITFIVASRSALPAALRRHETNGTVGHIGVSEFELTEESVEIRRILSVAADSPGSGAQFASQGRFQ